MITRLCTTCHGVSALTMSTHDEVMVDASLHWCSCHATRMLHKMRRFVWYALRYEDAPYGSDDNMPIEGVMFSNGHVATAIDDWKSTKYFHTFSAFVKSYVPQHIEWIDGE